MSERRITMGQLLRCVWRYGFTWPARRLALKLLGGVSIEAHREIAGELEDEIDALRIAFPAPYEREW
jgi:hypothetical protein